MHSSSNIVGATHAHYAWFTKTYGLYPSHDTLQVPALLEVVASVCTQPKTQAMILGKSIYNYELALKSTDIQIINELKLLVGTIDNKLTFSSHIKLVLSKVNAIDSDTALKLYKAYILPHFDYCSTLLIINQTLSDKLENTNYYVLRTLLKLSKSITYEDILSKYNLNIIEQKRLVEALTLLFKRLS